MKKSTGEPLNHPTFGQVTNVTELNSAGKRQRVSESGNVVIDAKCADGQERVMLLSSFAAPEPPPLEVIEQKA